MAAKKQPMVGRPHRTSGTQRPPITAGLTQPMIDGGLLPGFSDNMPPKWPANDVPEALHPQGGKGA